MAGVVLGTILDRVRKQLDDSRGERFDDQYIIGFLDECGEDLFLEFSALGIDYGEQVVVTGTMPAGTTDLDSLMGNEGSLAFLITPIAIEWKHPGEQDFQYRPIHRVDKVEDVQGVDGILSYEFRGQQRIILSPSTTDVVLRIRYDGFPSVSLDDNSKTFVRGLATVLVYKVAATIASRNGAEETSSLLSDLKADLHNAKQNLQQLLTKQDQGVPRRIGRFNRPRNKGLFFRIPVI